MALVEMQDIKKEYQLGEVAVTALQGVDFKIDRGDFIAVWGPSGSGKTTLLNMIGIIDEPTQGRICFDGQSVLKMSDGRRSELRNRSIGFVFQHFNLVPVLSALENVMLPLQIRGESYSAARIKAMDRLGQVDLMHAAKRRPQRLSGGQQQRVAIARALVTDPLLVVADEPTANLDSETSQEIIRIMRSLNEKECTTFVFSTHDQRLLDHVKHKVRIEDGLIVKDERRNGFARVA